MSQVTGKKVATTPMPTPTGISGNIIDSFNTQDDQTVNAPSIHIVKDALTTINDNLTAYDVDEEEYTSDKFRFAKSGNDFGMLDTEGNFMSFGSRVPLRYNLYFRNTKENNTDISVQTLSDSEIVVVTATSSSDNGASNWKSEINLQVTGTYETIEDHHELILQNTTSGSSASNRTCTDVVYKVLRKEKGTTLTIATQWSSTYGQPNLTLSITEF